MRSGYCVGLSLVAVYLLIVLFDLDRKWHLEIFDSQALIEGARFAVGCLGDGDFVSCGKVDGSGQSGVLPYPFIQYLPAALLVVLGTSNEHAVAALAVVCFIAVATALLVVVATFRDRPRHGALVVLALIGSSLVYHSTAAFGEGLVASLVVIAMCAAVRRNPLAIFVFVFAASLGKETLAPFVVALALICARTDEDAVFPRRRLTVAAVTAGALAIGVNAVFNIFRFGDVRNLHYLDPNLHTPGVIRKLEFLLAIFVSPSSGVVWYWPFFFALAIAGTAIGVHRLIKARNAASAYLPVLSVTGVMIVWFGGLSSWFSPFGWITYGPGSRFHCSGDSPSHTHGLSVARSSTCWADRESLECPERWCCSRGRCSFSPHGRTRK